jgi:hypothetical protein
MIVPDDSYQAPTGSLSGIKGKCRDGIASHRSTLLLVTYREPLVDMGGLLRLVHKCDGIVLERDAAALVVHEDRGCAASMG